MPARRLSIRKAKEIIRLAGEAGLTHRQIARSLSLSPTTVGACLKKAEPEGSVISRGEKVSPRVIIGG
jgi:DNA-binding transcriptional regulator LsrR (DeoR family)